MLFKDSASKLAELNWQTYTEDDITCTTHHENISVLTNNSAHRGLIWMKLGMPMQN